MKIPDDDNQDGGGDQPDPRSVTSFRFRESAEFFPPLPVPLVDPVENSSHLPSSFGGWNRTSVVKSAFKARQPLPAEQPRIKSPHQVTVPEGQPYKGYLIAGSRGRSLLPVQSPGYIPDSVSFLLRGGNPVFRALRDLLLPFPATKPHTLLLESPARVRTRTLTVCRPRQPWLRSWRFVRLTGLEPARPLRTTSTSS